MLKGLTLGSLYFVMQDTFMEIIQEEIDDYNRQFD